MEAAQQKEWVWDSRPIPGKVGKVEIFKRYKEDIVGPIKKKPQTKTIRKIEHVKPVRIDKIIETKPKKEKELKETAGIYVIICEIERHAYVGQSIDVENRLRSHKSAIKGNNKSVGKNYIKLCDHYKKHGIDAFQFINYIPLPFASLNELLSKEDEIMTEFSKSGYSLYNTSVNVTITRDSVYCPIEYQPTINKLVKLLTPDSVAKIEEFVLSL